MAVGEEHETGLAAFVEASKRDRVLGFLSKERTRRKLIDDLWHFRHWDPRYVVQLTPSSQTAGGVLAELTRRGATGDVYLISATRGLDRRLLGLGEAVRAVVATSSGTVISCIPERLAYFEGESPGDRVVLFRPS
jgi:hypothetical protein